jgi:hypothetical protein
MSIHYGWKFLSVTVLGLAVLGIITHANGAESATTALDASPPVIRVREAAMVPELTINAYAMRISDINQKTRDIVADAFTKCRDAEAVIVGEALKHPEKERELIARAKAEQSKLADVGQKSGLSRQRDGTKIARANRIANYEAVNFSMPPRDYARLKIKDPLPRLTAPLHLNDGQKANLAKIRAAAIAEYRAVGKEEASISQTSNSFDSKLWELEKRAVGIRAAERFRALLTQDQLAEWKQELDRVVPN